MKRIEKVIEVRQTTSYQSQNGDTYYSRELIVETDEARPKKICFVFKGANCNLLDAIQVGDKVEITHDIESHEHNGRYYTTVLAWQIKIIERPQQVIIPSVAPAAPNPEQTN